MAKYVVALKDDEIFKGDELVRKIHHVDGLPRQFFLSSVVYRYGS